MNSLTRSSVRDFMSQVWVQNALRLFIPALLMLPFLILFISESVEAFTTFQSGLLQVRWNSSVVAHTCHAIDFSGGWLVLMCGKEPKFAELAGVRIPDRAGTQREIDGFFTTFVKQQTFQGSTSGMLCDLVTVHPDVSIANRIRIWSAGYPKGIYHREFARCRIAGASLSEYLVSSAVILPAAPNSASFKAADDDEQNTLALLRPQDNLIAMRLGIEGWVATLFGFLGAGAGFVYSHGAETKKEQLLIRRYWVAKSAFNRAFVNMFADSLKPELLAKGRESFNAYVQALRATTEVKGEALSEELERKIAKLTKQLNVPLIDAELKAELYQAVEQEHKYLAREK